MRGNTKKYVNTMCYEIKNDPANRNEKGTRRRLAVA